EIEETASDEEQDEEKVTSKQLSLLKMQFEEKRRHIETEKRRNQEQWEEDRRKLGQTAFWYMIGRTKGEEVATGSGEGLTPEQQKRRDKFLKMRQKRQEEDKAKKEAEMEKKRRREERQREAEAQKKLEEERRQQEEELRRARLQQERLSRASDGAGNDGYATYRPGSGSNLAPAQDDHSAFAEFSGPVRASAFYPLTFRTRGRDLSMYGNPPGVMRGLYKVFGIGPRVITAKMIDNLYKYSSGGKEFVKIHSKTLSISVDGLSIMKQYWQSSKPAVQSKTMSNIKRPPKPPR
ncbi:predicted protein, partial [Nematostella vectensis]